ncbi:hypothetical protein JTB14_019660 [Gonioctena quinquepunctata]|nr:hypothetical protein JTB14_019660 [Gonioctena quinquepunctata]
MKNLVLLSTFLAASVAQRPSFAGLSPIGVPKVATRFQTQASDSGFPNRYGSGIDTSTTVPLYLQGPQYWPRENQPFSVLNAEHIRKQLYPNGVRQTNDNSAQNTNDLGLGSGSTTISDRTSSGTNSKDEFTQNRGSFDKGKGKDTPDSFQVFRNNQMVTYVYDSVSDAWYPKRY